MEDKCPNQTVLCSPTLWASIVY